jgi:hypothetical protein
LKGLGNIDVRNGFSGFQGGLENLVHEIRSLPKRAGDRACPALPSGRFDQGTTDMLRALSLAVLTALALPSLATEPPAGNTVVAQSSPAPQQTPKRDCEKKQDEGVSA